MAGNMRIIESRSSTTSSGDQTGLSPTSSSTPSDYEGLHAYLEQHVQTVMESLEALTLSSSSSPTSPTMSFDMAIVANYADCQKNLTWDHLPDDIWTDDIEEWLAGIPQLPVGIHPATIPYDSQTPSGSGSSSTRARNRMFPSFPLPALEIFTDIQWQPAQANEYTPSVYSPQSSAISPRHPRPLPLRTAAGHEVIRETLLSPTQYIGMDEIVNIAANMADVCTELRATTNRAEDSAEFDDSDSDSDVSYLDLNEPVTGHSINLHALARARHLRIQEDNPSLPSSFWGDAIDTIAEDRSSQSSRHSNSRRGHRCTAPSPQSNHHSTHSTHSHIRVRQHYISPDIHNRMARLANSGLAI